MALATRVESFLNQANRRMIQHAQRNRLVYGIVSSTLFLGGILVSATTLDLDWHRIYPLWLLTNVLIGAPVAISLNAIGLRVSAGVVGASLSFPEAFRTCCIALCSNLLPIPAGSLVQASSLASGGGLALQSGLIVVLGNIISLMLVAVLVGLILSIEKPALGVPILALGSTGLLSGTVYLLLKTSVRTMLGFFVIRIVRTLVMVVRIQLSFLIIGTIVSIMDAALFSGAAILGTVLAVFPAGLGISESLAAALALTTAVAPGAAFLAIAINRLTTLGFAALFLTVARSGRIGGEAS